jgi:hypothetical protein
MMTRRTAFLAALAVAALPATYAAAQTLDEVKAAAAKEGKVVWYDSLPRAEGDAILAEFQKAFPIIKSVEYLEVPGAAKTARITQESRDRGPTADVKHHGPASGKRHASTGYLHKVHWKALGVEMAK